MPQYKFQFVGGPSVRPTLSAEYPNLGTAIKRARREMTEKVVEAAVAQKCSAGAADDMAAKIFDEAGAHLATVRLIKSGGKPPHRASIRILNVRTVVPADRKKLGPQS